MSDPKPNGMTPDQVALNMLNALTSIQLLMAQGAKVQPELVQKLDDLIGHFEVLDLTMENLLELKDKPKLDIRDFARCWRDAADEIFGDEDDDGDDDGGEPVGAPDGPHFPSRIPD